MPKRIAAARKKRIRPRRRIAVAEPPGDRPEDRPEDRLEDRPAAAAAAAVEDEDREVADPPVEVDRPDRRVAAAAGRRDHLEAEDPLAVADRQVVAETEETMKIVPRAGRETFRMKIGCRRTTLLGVVAPLAVVDRQVAVARRETTLRRTRTRWTRREGIRKETRRDLPFRILLWFSWVRVRRRRSKSVKFGRKW